MMPALRQFSVIDMSTVRARHARIEARNEDGKKVYEASLSSETPVRRAGFTEVLRHNENSINMERAARGLVLLFNHDVDKPIGRVSDIGLRSDGKLAGRFTFSNTDAGRERQAQVDEGVLSDISIRYSIDSEERSENDDGETLYTVTGWTPMEASLVSVPADPHVGLGRSEELPTGNALRDAIQQANREVIPMSTKETTPKSASNASDSGVVNFESARKAGTSEGVLVERQRQADINGLFAAPKYGEAVYSALRDACLNDGSTLEQAQRKLLDLIGHESDDGYTAPQPTTEQGQRASQVRVTESGEDKVIEGMRKALDVKFSLGTTEELQAARQGNEFVGMGFADMARQSLQLQGVEGVYKWDARTAVGYALQPGAMPYTAQRDFVGHGSSVFTSLVENIAEKQMLTGYSEAAETWRQFCRIGSVSSFRQESRTDLSTFSALDEVPENGEYTHGTMSDRAEYITAKKYGKLFSITREMLVNDDVSGMSRAVTEIGRAAERKIGDLVYAILNNGTSSTAPYAMSDSAALFAARASTSGSNSRTSGAAPSVSELNAMKILMSGMKDFSGGGVGSGHRISYLVVPVALETTALVLQNATNDPTSNAATSGDANTGGMKPNPFAGTFQTIADQRLDDTSTAVYYGLADPTRADTIEVAFLNGNQTPQLESENGFTVDGITYKVRQEVGVKALSWVGMV
ncbi:MAG: hypothetical protein EX270_08950, partial [Pseudomonadales bacterium]